MAAYEDILRIGTVVSVHPERHRVRVRFTDKNDMVSDELPVLVPGSLKNKGQCLPDENELAARSIAAPIAVPCLDTIVGDIWAAKLRAAT